MKVAKSDFATFEELVQAIHESTACTGQRFSFGITGGGIMLQFAAADASLIVGLLLGGAMKKECSVIIQINGIRFAIFS